MSGEHSHPEYDLSAAVDALTVRVEALETTPPPPPPPPVSPVEGKVNLFVYASSGFDQYTRSPSEADKQKMADLYDFMVVWSPYFDSKLDWFPEAYEYTDLYGIKTDDPILNVHPEWILKDTSGKPLYLDWGCSGGKCPQWAGDIGNPAFRAHLINNVLQPVSYDYPGFHLDDVNMFWRTTTGSVKTAPADPRTGRTMLAADWETYVAVLLEEIRVSFPTHTISTNPIWYVDSPNLDNPRIDRQIAASDIFHFERGINDNGLKGGTGRYSVDALFRQVDRIHSLGCSVAWRDETGTTSKLQEYNLAAYLLTSDGSDYVSTEQWAQIAPNTLWRGYTVDLGRALGPRTKAGGLFRRDFENGSVFLNEPDAPMVSIPVSGFLFNGAPVTNLVLTQKEGAVVLNSPKVGA